LASVVSKTKEKTAPIKRNKRRIHRESNESKRESSARSFLALCLLVIGFGRILSDPGDCFAARPSNSASQSDVNDNGGIDVSSLS